MTAEERMALTDAELLAAVAGGDGAALASFYRRYLSRVLAFLMRETHDPEAAADLAAEVFAAVMISAHRYRGDGDSASGWVIGIARNKLKQSRKRGRIEDRARRRLGYEAVALWDDDIEHLKSLDVADAGGPIFGLVDELPADQRDAVRARVLYERSYSEIAAQLNCSEMVIRKRVSRGLARVRAKLKETS